MENDAFLAGFDGVEMTAAPQVDVPAATPDHAEPAKPENTPPAQPDQGADGVPKADESKPPVRTFTQEETDRIVQERLAREKRAHEKQLQEHPVLAGINRLAAQAGMPADQLLAALERQQAQQMAEASGIPEEVAMRLIKAENQTKNLETKLSGYEEAEQKKKADEADFAAFIDAFPEVKADSIPPEVWKARAAGKPLAEAYREHTRDKALSEKDAQIKTLSEKVAALEQLAKNRAAAPLSGGVGQHGTPNESVDPFMQGFDSVR